MGKFEILLWNEVIIYLNCNNNFKMYIFKSKYYYLFE